VSTWSSGLQAGLGADQRDGARAEHRLDQIRNGWRYSNQVHCSRIHNVATPTAAMCHRSQRGGAIVGNLRDEAWTDMTFPAGGALRAVATNDQLLHAPNRGQPARWRTSASHDRGVRRVIGDGRRRRTATDCRPIPCGNSTGVQQCECACRRTKIANGPGMSAPDDDQKERAVAAQPSGQCARRYTEQVRRPAMRRSIRVTFLTLCGILSLDANAAKVILNEYNAVSLELPEQRRCFSR
jgi:hypothetical protein